MASSTKAGPYELALELLTGPDDREVSLHLARELARVVVGYSEGVAAIDEWAQSREAKSERGSMRLLLARLRSEIQRRTRGA